MLNKHLDGGILTLALGEDNFFQEYFFQIWDQFSFCYKILPDTVLTNFLRNFCSDFPNLKEMIPI